jgi:hypothetical protein
LSQNLQWDAFGGFSSLHVEQNRFLFTSHVKIASFFNATVRHFRFLFVNEASCEGDDAGIDKCTGETKGQRSDIEDDLDAGEWPRVYTGEIAADDERVEQRGQDVEDVV